MHKAIGRKSWTCRSCLLRLRSPSPARRNFQTVCSSPSVYDFDHTGFTAKPGVQRYDDSLLRQVFDSRPFWREFSQRQFSASSKRTGLLQNQYLADPQGFLQFASVTLEKCQKITAKVLAAQSLEDYRAIAKDMDRLSDLLCRVVDVADFMRSNHPDASMREAAAQAFSLMYEYMNVLNTNPQLYQQLKTAEENSEVTKQWTDEEKATAKVLLKDFVNSAIHLDPMSRQKFVRLSSEISQLGPVFVQSMEPETRELAFAPNRLRGLDPRTLQAHRRWIKVAIPMYDPYPRMALGAVHDEEARKEIYIASRTASRKQIERLEELLSKRAELANLAGYSSFASMTLCDKMAKTPEAVVNFLSALNASNKGQVESELSKLLALKQIDIPGATRLLPWDHAYYVDRYAAKHSASRRSREPNMLPSFFSLGTVMQGLSRLFTKLYGVRFVPRETPPGETWNSDVRRLDVMDESNNHLAVIYCDLFYRPGKSHNPTHFTLRGSRRISAAEVAEAASLGPTSHPNDGMSTAVRSATGDLYQLPTIALVCNFEETSQDPSLPPSLLSQHDVETLFHEMGHAIHSVLGATDLQTIYGTRCATDFAELPSVLMENFATCPQVLSLYARHWETDVPLPEEMTRNMALHREDRHSILGGMDNETQIIMALLDQFYYSADNGGRGGIDTTAIFRKVTSAYSSLPDPPDTPTAWQGFFSHLYIYGATYYSYLFDRAIAHKVWTDVFAAGARATDRDAGEKFKMEVLRWGGGRDGWKCVAGVLGADNAADASGRLAEGGDEAMREVGRWGLGKAGGTDL